MAPGGGPRRGISIVLERGAALPREPIRRLDREPVVSGHAPGVVEPALDLPARHIVLRTPILLPHRVQGASGAPLPPEHHVAPKRLYGKVRVRNRKRVLAVGD